LLRPLEWRGGKQVLDFGGAPLFAELVILRHFQAVGWNGAWIDTYRKRTLGGMTERAPLPDERQRLLDTIYERTGSRHGCFDVFAWCGDAFVFAEAKRARQDRIRQTQVAWLDAAITLGVERSSLLIVEWRLAE
jgi:hypothetical protein